jgi:hypothetical protein
MLKLSLLGLTFSSAAVRTQQMQEGPFDTATPACGASSMVVVFVFVFVILRILIRSGQLRSLAL